MRKRDVADWIWDIIIVSMFVFAVGIAWHANKQAEENSKHLGRPQHVESSGMHLDDTP